MTLLFLSISFLCFAFLAIQRFHIALFLFFLLLPTYLVRFTVFGVPTTALEMMLLTLLFVWLLKEGRKKETWKSIQTTFHAHRSLVFASLTFFLFATIAVYTSIHTRAALGEWKAFYLEPILFAVILIAHIKSKKEYTHYILFPLIILGVITSILAIYQHFTGFFVPWDFWANRQTYRVTGWYGFPNAVGLFLTPLFPLALYLFLNTKTYIRFFSGLFLVLSPFAIAAAKGSGPIIGLAASIGFLMLFWKKTRLPILILSVFGLGIVFSLPNTHPISQELFAQNRSGQIRTNMWGETMQFLAHHPIQGAGLASYKTLIYPYRIDKWIEVFHHPHNIFLTMWVNIGLFGLVGFTWIIVWAYRSALFCYFKEEKEPALLFFLASLSALMVTGLVDSPYIKNDLSLFFWTVIALLVLAQTKYSSSEKTIVAK